jgi:hypothetical protein
VGDDAEMMLGGLNTRATFFDPHFGQPTFLSFSKAV